jgi:oligoribonuclease (3'-5' exoribonuclease)
MSRLEPLVYLWLDTEYSELNADRAVLLQVSALATDGRLRRLHPVQDDVNLVVRQRPLNVSPWVRDNLPELCARCQSREAVSPKVVERRLLELIGKATARYAHPEQIRPVLAGNSIHADAALLRRICPRVTARLHYRQLDVTAFKLVWRNWFKGPMFDKENPEAVRAHLPFRAVLGDRHQHDAHYDAQASIAELNFYLKRLKRNRVTGAR